MQSQAILINVSPEEYVAIKEKASQAGISMSELLRSSALKRQLPTPKQDYQSYCQLVEINERLQQLQQLQQLQNPLAPELPTTSLVKSEGLKLITR